MYNIINSMNYSQSSPSVRDVKIRSFRISFGIRSYKITQTSASTTLGTEMLNRSTAYGYCIA